MPEELRDLLADPVVRRSVGEDAFRRGAGYAHDGRVLDLEVRPNGLEIGADVAGSGGLLYHAFARWDRAADRWRGACSCPVAVDCKHVAATLVAARDVPTEGAPAAVPAPLPTWERLLADLVQEPGRAGGRALVPMGVQFAVEERPGRPTSIRLQPVVPGARAKWVRTGVSWRNLPHERHTNRDPAHVAALIGLHEASRVRGQNHWYGNTAEPPVVLEEFGPGLWPALRRAVDDGVALVTKGGGPVRLMPEPGELVVDVHDDGMGGLRLEPVVRMADDVRVPAGDLTLIGSPVHGAAVMSGGLVLTELQQVPRGVQKLLTARVVRVPAADRERFLGDFYPALRRALPVRSTSVELPEVRPPELCLRVEHFPGHRVELAWSVLYRTGDDVRRLPLARGTGVVPDTGRDAVAEDRLIRGLPLPPERLARLYRGHPQRPMGTAELQGIDAAVLTAEWLPRLAAAGVHVEQVGSAPDYRRSEADPVITVSATDTADGDWFDLGVTVRVDGEEIPFVQVFAALALGEEFLLLPSGMWFDVRRPEFDRLRRLLDEARALQETDASDEPDLRISRYQAGLWEELVEVGVVDEQSERWSRDVARLLDASAAMPAAPPASLAAQLRPYQLEGYQWLSVLWDLGLGGVLADDMGLGKTLQTLALFCRAAEAGELAAPVLVVAPTSVVSNWVREAERFAPGLRVVPATGRKRGTPLASVVAGADVVVTSYALLRLGEAEYRELPWSGLVLDEAQFVKNHRAKTYAAARRVPARFKLAITGTPVENDLMDLWAMLSIVAPGLFPNPKLFSEHYRVPIERNRDAEVLAALRRRIRPVMRRRTKEQVATELPPKQEQVLEVVLAPKHRRVYDTHLQAERRKVLGLVDDLQRNRFTIFRSLTLLRQLALDPSLVDEAYAGIGSSKTDAFLEHLTEVVAEGHRALVFSSFTGFLRSVRSRLDALGLPYAYLDGATADRDAVVTSFRSGEVPVFLISLKAGGSGLNLTEADYVFVLDPWWNPAAEAQAVDRAHRIGQDKTVMVYRLVAADTIEEKVLALQERKRDLFARVMEDDDGALTGPLTAEDIRGLFS
ncbi:DEAD/DEAH box helicase [Blastococcus sp. TF02A-26]|uniref:DEAD/DEAH box helicase n=1 Tax=Blastococcus sp. TF02A-26 TaxID=2250577 RepID=UPI000DEBE6FC|nr:DEAD/DEAH box helicase [Blastococcus sp. TF02A-26]RBY85074.1 helicase SNF2 [Blastococcus sp. TF02A-26]